MENSPATTAGKDCPRGKTVNVTALLHVYYGVKILQVCVHLKGSSDAHFPQVDVIL